MQRINRLPMCNFCKLTSSFAKLQAGKTLIELSPRVQLVVRDGAPECRLAVHDRLRVAVARRRWWRGGA